MKCEGSPGILESRGSSFYHPFCPSIKQSPSAAEKHDATPRTLIQRSQPPNVDPRQSREAAVSRRISPSPIPGGGSQPSNLTHANSGRRQPQPSVSAHQSQQAAVAKLPTPISGGGSLPSVYIHAIFGRRLPQSLSPRAVLPRLPAKRRPPVLEPPPAPSGESGLIHCCYSYQLQTLPESFFHFSSFQCQHRGTPALQHDKAVRTTCNSPATALVVQISFGQDHPAHQHPERSSSLLYLHHPRDQQVKSKRSNLETPAHSQTAWPASA